MELVGYILNHEHDITAALLYHLNRKLVENNPGWLKPDMQVRYDAYKAKFEANPTFRIKDGK